MQDRFRTRGDSPARAGFTLIELLVVIAIIAVLMSLSVGAVMRMAGVQQTKSTREVLNLSNRMLRARWSEVTDRARTEPIPPAEQGKVDALSGGDPRRARVIWIKLRQKQAFPQSFAEVLSPGGNDLKPLSTYVNQLQSVGATASASPQPYESAVCLLMALEQTANSDELNNVTQAFTLPSNKQIRGLVDGWQNPIVFCRWPTGSPELNPSGAQPGLRDLGDPQGLLTEQSWIGSAGFNAFKGTLHDLPGWASGRPQSYNLTPTIISGGPDKAIGLDLKTLNITNIGQTADNLSSNALQ